MIFNLHTYAVPSNMSLEYIRNTFLNKKSGLEGCVTVSGAFGHLSGLRLAIGYGTGVYASTAQRTPTRDGESHHYSVELIVIVFDAHLSTNRS